MTNRKQQLTPYLESVENLYKVDWECGSRIKIDDIWVDIPQQPPLEKMRNYGLPIEQQKFKALSVPHDLKKWDKPLKDLFVSAMWHKRKNGEWWLIKGQPVYLNRFAWTFLNFWVTEIGTLPQFRMEAVEYFLVVEQVFRDKNCLGLLDIKPRRIGDTEKTLFVVWFVCSMVYNAVSGMQSYTDVDAEKNFKRLVEANKKMPFFFRPSMPTSDTPGTKLSFAYPPTYVTGKTAGEEYEQETLSALNSSIDYQATILGKYDGQRLTVYYLDEPGKIKAFDVNEQWKIVKPTLTLNNNKKVIGKAFLTTTVEDFAVGDTSTLARLKVLWDQSDPNDLGTNGRTVSGLYRIFRSARLSAEVDEWGFHKSDQAEVDIKEELDRLLKLTDYDGISQLRRKFPLSITDVFAPSHSECVLFPALLQNRRMVLMEEKDAHGQLIQERIAVPGNLIWKNGVFGGDVIFVAHPKGRWHISQHPLQPNKRMRGPKGLMMPVCGEDYTMGCDPIDTIIENKKQTRNGKKTRSLGAGAVLRRYNELVDGELEKDEDGQILFPALMMTDQYVCDYQYRPEDPNEYFDDMLKTCIYYSVPMFFEKDKPSIQTWFISNGFEHYLMDRPLETKSDRATFKKTEKGAKATTPLVRLYTDALKSHVYSRVDTFWHPRILECHNAYNVTNRSDRDLTVACGFALLANMDNKYRKILPKAQDDWNNVFFARQKYR